MFATMWVDGIREGHLLEKKLVTRIPRGKKREIELI